MKTVPAATPDRPLLVGDIGGTNARFALVHAPGAAPTEVTTMACADYPDLGDAAEAYLAATASTPAAACIAVAGPVQGDRFRLTNGPWDFSTEAIRRRLGLAHLRLLNDFAALALSLPRLRPDDLCRIGTPTAVAGQPLAVLGPGTGLGVAGLHPSDGGWIPVCGEGGHVDLPVIEEREIEIARVLRAEQQTVSAECVLSGTGLTRLHRCLCQVHGVDHTPLTPAQITELGCTGEEELCVEALEVFCALLGGVAGNLALTLGARGGVFLGGGILPRIPDMLEHSEFRRRFDAKLRMTDYVKAIATQLIVATAPALIGAAAHLDHPQLARAGAA